MRLEWLSELRKYALGTFVALACSAGVCHAGEADADLRTLLEKQSQEIQELKQRLDAQAAQVAVQAAPAAAPGDPANAALAVPQTGGRVVIDDASIKKIVADYLQQNPGAGMPSGVQTGYSSSTGFTIRSPQNPEYIDWGDEGRIPFELRLRGRIQVPYYFYKVVDTTNHLTGQQVYPSTTQSAGGTGSFTTANNPTGIKGANSTGDFSALEVKRLRLIWEGTAFDPNFRYHMELDGTTRGLTDNGSATNPSATSGTANLGPNVGNESQAIFSNGAVDNTVRLFSVYAAYDFHPCCGSNGCGDPCPDGTYKYSPTLTVIVGKLKPFFAFEEILGSGNAQFVEFGATEWFFDADDDNLMNWWGVQYSGCEGRLFAMAGVTNGNESQVPALTLDDYPGFNAGFWYDFGGTWNSQRKRYDLYGDCQADIDYSYKPVLRVGGAVNFVWQDAKAQYGGEEQSRFRTAWAQPGGSTLPGILNGAGITSTNGSPEGMASADEYTYEAFAAGKYRGFSFSTDWFFRYYDNFQGVNGPGGLKDPIFYTTNNRATGAAMTPALFTRGGMFDMGQQLDIGYFLIPKKLEVALRWGVINGQSGDLYGDGKFANGPTVNGTKTIVYQDAFKQFHTSNEYTAALNYYIRRQQIKIQTDLSYYQGGNPAAGGASPAGYITGVDGWLLRTQLQFAF